MPSGRAAGVNGVAPLLEVERAPGRWRSTWAPRTEPPACEREWTNDYGNRRNVTFSGRTGGSCGAGRASRPAPYGRARATVESSPALTEAQLLAVPTCDGV